MFMHASAEEFEGDEEGARMTDLARKKIGKHKLQQLVVKVVKAHLCHRAAGGRVGVVHGDPPQGPGLPHGGHDWPATKTQA